MPPEYQPVPPPITYFGSKSQMVKDITKHFPDHKTYVDVFGGSGAVLLGKRPSKIEVYNDLNHKMAALFRVLADPGKSAALKTMLQNTLYSRAEFESCKASINSLGDEIEIARQMMVIHRQSHGGLGQQWSYCVDSASVGMSASVRKFHIGIERLTEVSRRLRKCQVENLPWQDLIQRYDGDGTLFFLDPPYVPDTRVSGKYEHEMSLDDHAEMVTRLLAMRGYGVLCGYIHSVYLPLEQAGWRRVDIDCQANSSAKRAERIESLWISPTRDAPAPRQYTNRQAAAYQVHADRVAISEAKIREAITSLKRIDKPVSKTEVARMTGISRVHLSRRYAHLFPE